MSSALQFDNLVDCFCVFSAGTPIKCINKTVDPYPLSLEKSYRAQLVEVYPPEAKDMPVLQGAADFALGEGLKLSKRKREAQHGALFLTNADATASKQHAIYLMVDVPFVAKEISAEKLKEEACSTEDTNGDAEVRRLRSQFLHQERRIHVKSMYVSSASSVADAFHPRPKAAMPQGEDKRSTVQSSFEDLKQIYRITSKRPVRHTSNDVLGSEDSLVPDLRDLNDGGQIRRKISNSEVGRTGPIRFFSRGRSTNIADLFSLPTKSKIEIEKEHLSEEGSEKSTFYIRKVLCIISRYPYYTLFKSWLENVYDSVICSDQPTPFPIEKYISLLVNEIPAPPPGNQLLLCLPLLNDFTMRISHPAVDDFPLVDFSLRHLFLCLDMENIITLMCAVLTDCRILFISECGYLLFNAIQCVLTLMFPLTWCNTCIPEIPGRMVEWTDSPTPFIMGLRREHFPRVTEACLEGLVVVDLDGNCVMYSTDLPVLQKDETKDLTATLRRHVHPELSELDRVRFPSEKAKAEINWDYHIRQIRVSFLMFIHKLLGNYETCIVADGFDRERFLRGKQKETHDFYKGMLETQVFAQLIYHTKMGNLHPLYRKFCSGDITEVHLRRMPPVQPDQVIHLNFTLPAVPPGVSQRASKASAASTSQVSYQAQWPEVLKEENFDPPSGGKLLFALLQGIEEEKWNAQIYLLRAMQFFRQKEYCRCILEYLKAEERDHSLQYGAKYMADMTFPLLTRKEVTFISTRDSAVAQAIRQRGVEELEVERAEFRKSLHANVHHHHPQGLPTHCWCMSTLCDEVKANAWKARLKEKPKEKMTRFEFLEVMYQCGIIEDQFVGNRLFATLSKLDGKAKEVQYHKVEQFLDHYLKGLSVDEKKMSLIGKVQLDEGEKILWVQNASTDEAVQGWMVITSVRAMFKGKHRRLAVSYRWTSKPFVRKVDFKGTLLKSIPCCEIACNNVTHTYSWHKSPERDLFCLVCNELSASVEVAEDLDNAVYTQIAIRVVALAKAASETSPRHRLKVIEYLGPLFRYHDFPSQTWYKMKTVLLKVLNMSLYDQKEKKKDKTRNPLEIVSELRDQMANLIIFNIIGTDENKTLDRAKIKESCQYKKLLYTAGEIADVDLKGLRITERACFFINLFNVMVMHGIIASSRPSNMLELMYFNNRTTYNVGGALYSLADIQHGILRCNMHEPFFSTPRFRDNADERLAYVLPKPVDPRILLCLCFHNRMSPWIYRITPDNFAAQLHAAAIEYVKKHVRFATNGAAVLPSILQEHAIDFGDLDTLLHQFIPYHLSSSGSPDVLAILGRYNASIHSKKSMMQPKFRPFFEVDYKNATTLYISSEEKSVPSSPVAGLARETSSAAEEAIKNEACSAATELEKDLSCVFEIDNLDSIWPPPVQFFPWEKK